MRAGAGVRVKRGMRRDGDQRQGEARGEGRADRRTVLADAAIGVLADAGVRGLTHRAVDAAAGLPVGTTSAYLRTRQALLTALVRRLVELDQGELQMMGSGRRSGRPMN